MISSSKPLACEEEGAGENQAERCQKTTGGTMVVKLEGIEMELTEDFLYLNVEGEEIYTEDQQEIREALWLHRKKIVDSFQKLERLCGYSEAMIRI